MVIVESFARDKVPSELIILTTMVVVDPEDPFNVKVFPDTRYIVTVLAAPLVLTVAVESSTAL